MNNNTWLIRHLLHRCMKFKASVYHTVKLVLVIVGLVCSFQAVALPTVTQSCEWNQPGQNRFTGNVVDAVHDYLDIPINVRVILQHRVAVHQYDDIVAINRTTVIGAFAYEPELIQMHFGANTVCNKVTRLNWKELQIERALVYCESGYCLIVPLVCGNLSRIIRKPAPIIERVVKPVVVLELPTVLLLPQPSVSIDNPLIEIQVPHIDINSESTTIPVDSEFKYLGSIIYLPSQPVLTGLITPVTEPETWIMVLTGLAVLVLKTRKR